MSADHSERGPWPVTLAEWDDKMPGWELHDVEGYIVAVRGRGIAWLQSDSVFGLHAEVCEHEGTANTHAQRLIGGAMFDKLHQEKWQRQYKYGIHWCIPAGVTWFGGEYIDWLARQCTSHDEAIHEDDVSQ